MASLSCERRMNPETNKKEEYWIVNFRVDGKQKRQGLGFLSKRDALKMFKLREAELTLNVPPPAAAPPRLPVPTLNEWWGGVDDKPWKPSRMLDYLDAKKSSKSTRDAAHAARRWFLPLFGTLRLDEITEAHRDKLVAAIRRKLKSRSAIIYLGWLRKCLQVAVDDKVILFRPALRPPANDDRRVSKWLNPAQTSTLLDELDRRAAEGITPARFRNGRLAIQVQETLFARPGEVCHMRWENLVRDADWQKGTLAIIDTDMPDGSVWKPKAGGSRTLALPPGLLTALRDHWIAAGRPKTGWMFPGRDDPRKPMTTYRGALANACDSAALPRLNPHALRHTGATRLALAGVERRTVQVMGGWTSGEMLDEIYEHTCDDRQAEVAALFEVKRTPRVVAGTGGEAEGR